MKIKRDTLFKASLSQLLINFLKYAELLVIIPMLIKSMGGEYAQYLEVLSVVAWLIILDLNLPNFLINIKKRYNEKKTITNLLKRTSILYLVVSLFIINFQNWSTTLILALILILTQIINGIFSGVIKRVYGFDLYNLISIGFNFISLTCLYYFLPKSAKELFLIKSILSLILVIVYYTLFIRSKKIKDSNRLDTIPFISVLRNTKEYTAQRLMEYLNGNLIGLLIVPINPNYAIILFSYKIILNMPAAMANIFVQLYHQVFLTDGFFKNENKFYWILVLLPLLSIGLLLQLDFVINQINSYFGLKEDINSVHLFGLCFWTLFTSLNKKLNIKRQIGNQSDKTVFLTVLLIILIIFITKIYVVSITIILVMAVLCESIYSISLYGTKNLAK